MPAQPSGVSKMVKNIVILSVLFTSDGKNSVHKLPEQRQSGRRAPRAANVSEE